MLKTIHWKLNFYIFIFKLLNYISTEKIVTSIELIKMSSNAHNLVKRLLLIFSTNCCKMINFMFYCESVMQQKCCAANVFAVKVHMAKVHAAKVFTAKVPVTDNSLWHKSFF